MNTGLYTDPIFLQHDTGNHPEHSGRLVAITQAVAASGLEEVLDIRPTTPAADDALALIHDVDYIRQVEAAALSGESFLGTPDCALSEQTYNVARHAAGALVDAATEVAEGHLDNAFVACRPPGHHAEHHQAMGFCFFNNVGIGAEHLVRHMGYERVLIFDFDVHHGNGTQHTFEARKDVFYASIHQDPRSCYPGTGFEEESGTSEGSGYTLNVPMLPQSTDEDYIRAFQTLLLPAFREFRPQFIFLSAGFDAHRDDPLAAINVTQHGFDALIQGMKELARDTCGGKMVSILEGGYNLERLSECVSSHLRILQDDPT